MANNRMPPTKQPGVAVAQSGNAMVEASEWPNPNVGEMEKRLHFSQIEAPSFPFERRQVAGATPKAFLKARENAASES